MDRRETVANVVGAAGSVSAVAFYGLRPFAAFSLSLGEGCGNLFEIDQCKSPLRSFFADPYCGTYSQHRTVFLISLIAISVAFSVALRLTAQHSKVTSMISGRSLRLAIPATLLGLTSALWSWGFFDPCDNVFLSKWQAVVTGLGITVGAWLVAIRLSDVVSTGRRSPPGAMP